MIIRFCDNNQGAGRVCRRLVAEHPELDIQSCKCLKKCGICNCTLFALVNDEPVRGRTGDDLYRNIVAAVTPR